jgi:ABC-type Zn2+ transport system substrate-binding protein/surface adhesin
MVVPALEGLDRARVRRVGQLVDVQELVLGLRRHEPEQERGADEAGAAGDQDLHEASEGEADTDHPRQPTTHSVAACKRVVRARR